MPFQARPLTRPRGNMDRKERIRAYKETERPMGVFRVYNAANGKSFVGSSNDLPAMLNRQRFQLELGSHPNRELQRDWNECGADTFVIEVLDTLESSEESQTSRLDELRILEQMWLERLEPYGERGYNRPPTGNE